jgi:ATP-dependent RNA helicase DDX51/DBP6
MADDTESSSSSSDEDSGSDAPTAVSPAKKAVAAASSGSDSASESEDEEKEETESETEQSSGTAASKQSDEQAARRAARVQQILALLPNWALHPRLIASERTLIDGRMPFFLHPALLAVLQGMGFSSLLPVQTSVLPALLPPAAMPSAATLSLHGALTQERLPLLGDRDVCVCAPTGSGKTLTYLLPVVQSLSTRRVPGVRALVVVPTRALAAQVLSVAQQLCGPLGLHVACATADNDLAVETRSMCSPAQAHAALIADKYLSGAPEAAFDSDIVITTPGRLIAHLNSSPAFPAALDSLQWLVLDECDKLLGGSYGDWVYELMTTLSGKKNYIRKMLFSATFSRIPHQLSSLRLRSPVYYATSAAPETVDSGAPIAALPKHVFPPRLSERLVVCEEEFKPLVLFLCIDYLCREAWCKYVVDRKAAIEENISSKEKLASVLPSPPTLLIFCSSAARVHRIARLLELLSCCRFTVRQVIAGQRGAKQHLDEFSHGKVQVLVSTDASARGIDLPSLEYVVNYDVPRDTDGYVHRVGRTARGMNAGTALTIATKPQYLPFIRNLRQRTNTRVTNIRSSVLRRGWRFIEAMARVNTGFQPAHDALQQRMLSVLAGEAERARADAVQPPPATPSRTNRYADMTDSDDDSSSGSESEAEDAAPAAAAPDDDAAAAEGVDNNKLEELVVALAETLPACPPVPPTQFMLPLLAPMRVFADMTPTQRYNAACRERGRPGARRALGQVPGHRRARQHARAGGRARC